MEPWSRSSLTQERLEELVEEGLLRPVTDVVAPKWITPEEGVDVPNPPAGHVLSFMAFHERGLGIPTSRFLWALPSWYEVELHIFNPNSITLAAIFITVYEGYLGIPPHWNLWLYLFKAEHFTKAAEGGGSRKMVRAGGCTLQMRQEQSGLYFPAQLMSSNRGWQEGWFYLRNDDGWLPPYTGHVVIERPSKWRWGAPGPEQPKL
jgi:hypothetical protein